MTLHLLKLFVGLATLPELAAFQREKLAAARLSGEKPELSHVTRHWPKRADELLDGGSLYWIMSSTVVARQRLVTFRPVEVDGVLHCRIVFDPALIPTAPRPHRPFQGWRYLQAADAPPDLPPDIHPGGMARELAKLGLL